jgi:putative acetyltransferase
MSEKDIEIIRAQLESPEAQALICELNAELQARYPEPGANHFRVDADELAPGRGAFLIGYVDGKPVACGAIRKHDDRTAEIKRMYVAPAARGKGLSRRILSALEAEGRALGVRRLVLETGPRQVEALALYSRSGFVEIPLFGEYLNSPQFSVCMEKELKSP